MILRLVKYSLSLNLQLSLYLKIDYLVLVVIFTLQFNYPVPLGLSRLRYYRAPSVHKQRLCDRVVLFLVTLVNLQSTHRTSLLLPMFAKRVHNFAKL